MRELSPEFRAKLHAGLDPQQSLIVDHVDGPAMVVAGAGAGKTKTIVHRCASLIAKGVNPASILLLTFTNDAAKNVVAKARRFEPAADRIVGGTFHSVARRLIKENHTIFGLPPNFSMCNPGDVHDIIRRLLADDPIRNGPKAQTIAKIISFSINTGRPLKEVVDARYPKWSEHAEAIAALAERYADHKKRFNILDFDDLLVFFSAMANHPVAGPVLRRRFRYVMIDEVQDCNKLQVDICRGLGGEGGNILVVGDPSQAIYAFRGSSPSIMFAFRDHWPGMKTYLIETNYRSTPEIVTAAGRVDASMNERFARKLAAGRQSVGVRPCFVSVDDRPEEAGYIAQAIMDRREEGMTYGEQAVLVRSTRHLRHVEVELAARNIPTVVKGGISIYKAEHVNQVLAPLRIAANPLDEPAWCRLLCLYPKVGDKLASRIAHEVMDAGSIHHCIAVLKGIALTKPTLAGAVEVLEAAASSRDPLAAFTATARAMDGIMQQVHEDEWDWRKKDIDALVELSRGRDDLDEFLATLSIEVSIDKGFDGEFDAPDPDGVVTLSTIHSAKGLEWTTVYIPSFIKGHIPSGFGSEEEEDDDEERRLLYVAVTRSKRDLVMVRPRLMALKGEPVFAPPSPFEALVTQGAERVRPYREPEARQPLDDLAGLSVFVR